MKRSSTNAELLPLHTRQISSKRTKLSAATESSSESSEATTKSDISALRSSVDGSDETSDTSVSEESSEESDIESSDTSSEDSDGLSDAPSDESEAEEVEESDADVVTIGGPKKPQIILPEQVRAETKKLYDKLQEFLPKLREANGILEDGTRKINMEEVDENEQHIEMNLGLGVLEEQRDSEQDEDDSKDEDNESGDEREVMRDLLGIKGCKEDQSRTPAIQEVENELPT